MDKNVQNHPKDFNDYIHSNALATTNNLGRHTFFFRKGKILVIRIILYLCNLTLQHEKCVVKCDTKSHLRIP